ncbi:MAG TPA: extracellular solute-binding protein [Candidatus Hydrogenedentes bacterium]|nr:extracellular solute-binding protein [Candidatus Hydrogenedentota bacterium]
MPRRSLVCLFLMVLAGCLASEAPLPPREALAKACERVETILRQEPTAVPAAIRLDAGGVPDDPRRVRVWVYNDPILSRLAVDPETMAAFRRAHPDVTLDCQGIGPWMVGVQKLTVNLAAGDAGDLPDVALVARAWLPRLASSGRIMPMEGLLPSTLLEDVRGPSRAALTIEGALYAMPADGFCTVLFYNEDLLPDGAPGTWDELRTVAAGIPRREDFYPIGDIPFIETLWSAGGSVCGGGRSGLAGPAALEALEFILSLRNDGLAHPWSLGDPDQAQELFLGGRVAMTVASSRHLARVQRGSFPVGVAPVPGKAGPISAVSENALVVFARYAETKRDAIVEVLDFLTGPEMQGVEAVAVGSVPVRESVAARVSVPSGLAAAYENARHTPAIVPWSSVEFELERYLHLAFRWRPEALD